MVARTKRSGTGIFESNWTCLVPSVFIGFYGFYGFCGLSGKPSEQSFLICIKKKIEKGKTLRTKKVVDIENENLVTSRKCCGLFDVRGCILITGGFPMLFFCFAAAPVKDDALVRALWKI